jgi:mannose-1-phosphate guanylyltransferase
MSDHLFAVIMAGGKGTRFWPLSRADRPKQLLAITGEKTMIQQTIDRLLPMVSQERILIVTGAAHVNAIREQLPSLPAANIIAEPIGRNTAPCVALAASIIAARDPEGVMAIFPADHVITQPEILRKTIATLLAILDHDPIKLATIGIAPSYPETGYGYIKKGEGADPVFSVDAFCEKPDESTAQTYVDSGDYFWNAGMFFWKVSTILARLSKDMPELMAALTPITSVINDDDAFNEAISRHYPALPAQSIDYGVMEKAGADKAVIVAVCDPGWSDVGSWRSLYDLTPEDANGNHSRGDFIAVDATGTLVHNTKRLVAVVGLDDVVVIETDDAILVVHKDKTQKVREVTEELQRRKRDDLL